MKPARRLFAVLALAASAQAAGAQGLDDNICTRGPDGVFYGGPFTLSYRFPVAPPPEEEALPPGDSLFPAAQPEGGTAAQPRPACAGGGIVGALNCVAEQIESAGAAVTEAGQSALDAARRAAAAAAGQDAAGAPAPTGEGAARDRAAHVVTMTMTFRPVFHAGTPAMMTLEPAGPTDISSPRTLTDHDAQQMAGRAAMQMQVLRNWRVMLGGAQTEAVIDGAPLGVAAPQTVPGVAPGSDQAPGYRMPAACASLFRAHVDRDALRERRAPIAERIARLKAEIARQREEAGVLGYFWDSEWVDRAETIVERLERQLGAIDREIAEKDDYIARRGARLSEEDRARELEEIRNDPERLAAEEQRRRDALVAAARESRKYKWQIIEGEQQYAQQLAAYDALIARAEAEGNGAYADQLRSDKGRLETARDQWRTHTEGVYQARLNEEQRLQDQNRADGIGPAQDATSLLLSEGRNPIEVLEGGAREAARDFVRDRVATDARTLGGAATEEYGLEDFARDLGDSNAEMWENPDLFLDRYGSYMQGAGEGARDAVVDLAVLAAEAGDTAGEAFESGLSDITGAEFNTFGRENLDTLAGAATALSETDALAIGDAAGALAVQAGRRLEQMAGRGEEGVREALRGTGYATASVLGAEEVAVAGILRASRLAGAAGEVAGAVNAADAAGDAARAANAAGDAGRAADTANDAARLAGPVDNAARAAGSAGGARATDAVAEAAGDSAGGAGRLAGLPPDATIEGDLAAEILGSLDDTAAAASSGRATTAAGGTPEPAAPPIETARLDGGRTDGVTGPASLDTPDVARPQPAPDARPETVGGEGRGMVGALDGQPAPDPDATTIVDPTPDAGATTRIEPRPDAPDTTVIERAPDPDATTIVDPTPNAGATTRIEPQPDAPDTTVIDRSPDRTARAPDPDATTIIERTPDAGATTRIEPQPDAPATTIIDRSPDRTARAPDPDATTIIEPTPDAGATTRIEPRPDAPDTTVIERAPDSTARAPDPDATTIVDPTPDAGATTRIEPQPDAPATTIIDRSPDRTARAPDAGATTRTEPRPDEPTSATPGREPAPENIARAPDPDATVDTPAPDPDATVDTPAPDPDVTVNEPAPDQSAAARQPAPDPDATVNEPAPGPADPDATVDDPPMAAAAPDSGGGVRPETGARPGSDLTFYDDPARAPPTAERVQRPLDTEVMDATLDTSPDYPFADNMATLDGIPDTGRVSGPAFEIDAKGKAREIPGRLLMRPDGSNLLLGDLVGTGATATVFTNALDETQVIRLVEHTGGAKPSDTFDLVGRRVAETVQDADGNGLFRTTRTHDQFFMTDPQGKQWMVTVEENLAHTGGGVTDAKQRFEGRRPNAAEELTMALAIRQMNRRGVVWTDHKLANFDIVPNPQSPTGYQMVIFDTGGIRPASGADPIARGRTAQELQRIFDQTPPLRGGRVPPSFVTNIGRALDYFDNRVFAPADPKAEIMPSFSPNQINRADHYHDLSNMHHEDLEDLATQTLGHEIRIPLQR